MKTLTFFAHGRPVGQPRARACIRGRHASVYDPGTADGWKRDVIFAANEAWDKVPFDGPISLCVEIIMPRPKGHFRANGTLKDNAPSWHTSKPDLDNVEKAIKDALTNAGVWRDDSQVCRVNKEKIYANGTVTGAKITISEITE